MPVLNFKEITDPRDTSQGKQDSFELFARDFLTLLGYEVVSGPDRGADDGRDLIVTETRSGVGGQTIVRWLVSCKHQAFSGKSVGVEDEIDVAGRVKAHQCHGFIGFYSTIPSSSLTRRVESSCLDFDHQFFDREKIEANLLASANGFKIAQRYFPRSVHDVRRPASVFYDSPRLRCKHCNKDLLPADWRGIVVVWSRVDPDDVDLEEVEVVDVYACCKVTCEPMLKSCQRGTNLIDTWEDLKDMTIPSVYFNWVHQLWHQLHKGPAYSEKAFNGITVVLTALYPYVAREPTAEEAAHLKELREFSSSSLISANYHPVR